MPQFRFQVGVNEVEGYQLFAVDAATAEEALVKIRSGGGEIVEDQLEVIQLNWNDVTLVEE